MKIEKMLHTIGQIDDDLIEDALIHGPQKKIPLYKMSAFRRAVAVAACFVLIVGIALSMPTLFKPNTENPSATPTGPNWDNPDVPGTLLPPSVQVGAFASWAVSVCPAAGSTQLKSAISAVPASSLKNLPQVSQLKYALLPPSVQVGVTASWAVSLWALTGMTQLPSAIS